MEPVANLKRALDVSLHRCIICQEEKDDVVFSATPQGLETLKNTTHLRKKFRDVKYQAAVDRLTSIFSDSHDNLPSLVWHKACYSNFTHKKNIAILQRAANTPVATKSRNSSAEMNNAQAGTDSKRKQSLLRSGTKAIDWKLCMFCQDSTTKQSTCSVRTMNMSENILSAAKYNEQIHVRVADVADIVAAEGIYHANCMKKFFRDVEKAKIENKSVDLAMVWLAQELRQSADRGHVLELVEVRKRYEDLAGEAGIVIPASYLSRLATFGDRLSSIVGGVYDFIVLHDQVNIERKTVMVPRKFSHVPVSNLKSFEEDIEDKIPIFRSGDDDLLSMVHMALKLRSDIQSQPEFTGVDVNENAVIDCVPASLYMFIRLLIGGQALLEEANDEEGVENTLDKRESFVQSRVLSISQDIVFNVSGERKTSPKHVGLGLTLHQATRSKSLVEMFYNAGHIDSYRNILRIDTALAKVTLQSMDQDTGSVVPPNLVPGVFTHFSADNIDINDSTLDGKNTFHATQVAAWQRGPIGGPAIDTVLSDIRPSDKVTLEVPKALETIIPVNFTSGSIEPIMTKVNADWFKKPSVYVPESQAYASDLAFFLVRQNQDSKPSWTAFNESHSKVDPPKTTVGYMPIIQAPAHELSTLNTVVRRVIHVAKALNQKNAVLTVDQALFPGLMKLKWGVPEYRNVLIPRLGGLHVSMNFLKVLGQHMADSGLVQVWVESGLLGINSAEKVMDGKSYAKGIRAHKLTVQALWQLLHPMFVSYLDGKDHDLNELIGATIGASDKCDYEALVSVVSSSRFQNILAGFVSSRQVEYNFDFWWRYIDMVNILLRFTRAQRDGLWQLHLSAFRDMLPYFHRYDHTNYARWGCVYLQEMKNLPKDVEEEFQKGNFVVKGSDGRKFNQVSPDHSQEWLNGTGKRGGGIVGITKTTTALTRWTLSFNFRAQISAQTRQMFHVGDGTMNHNEATPARTKRDNSDENNIVKVLQQFKVFTLPPADGSSEYLHSIATKDVATPEIQESLLSVEVLGQSQLDTFVEERLVNLTVKLGNRLQKSNALTFKSLYEVRKLDTKGTVTTLKADRTILQRLITAFQAGRKVNLHNVLKHELMKIPISIANSDGSLRTGSKTILADVITKDVVCPSKIDIDPRNSCLIIDGQAVVVALGKPAEAKTFGDLADVFVENVLVSGKFFKRIDVTFDRYVDNSIKSGTRKSRSKKARPIRKVVDDRTVPLPQNWNDFLAVPSNKQDLALLLSNELIAQAPGDKVVVVAGGFRTAEETQSTKPLVDIEMLRANHEEADTRVVLHCIQADADTIVVAARDTDILLLLVAFFSRMKCKQLWMKAGTAKQRKYIPVHDIRLKLSFPESVYSAILPFHAITGCDTVSYFSGHSKKTAWEVFTKEHALLQHLGQGELTNSKVQDAEQFICKMYRVVDVRTTDEARVKLFNKCKALEALPPTSDALRGHIERAHYQTLIWRQSDKPKPDVPPPTDFGWKVENGYLVAKLSTLPPVPKACTDIVQCSCRKGCTTLSCSCRKWKLNCTGACKCSDDERVCMNKPVEMHV